MKRKMNESRKRRIGGTLPSVDLLGTICIMTTDDGCAVEIGEGERQIRLDMPLEKAVDVAASIMVACIPVASLHGFGDDEFATLFSVKMTEKYRAAMAQMRDAPS